MDLNIFIHAALISIVISFIEIFFVHSDEEEFGFRIWFSHGIHTFPFTFIMVELAFLAVYAYPLLLNYLPIPIPPVLIILAIFFISGIKIHAISMIAKGISEKWIHCWIVAALIAASPYIYPFVRGFLPNFF